MEDKDLKPVKAQILDVLAHPEADEGLYFRNFTQLHEVDERPKVNAEEAEILDALQELEEATSSDTRTQLGKRNSYSQLLQVHEKPNHIS